MKEKVALSLSYIGLAAILAFVTYMEFAVWGECLDKNSFYYCMRTIK